MAGLIDPSRVVAVFFSARKAEDVPFRIPTQGVYDDELQARAPETSMPVTAAVAAAVTGRFIPPALAPLLRPVRPGVLLGKLLFR